MVREEHPLSAGDASSAAPHRPVLLAEAVAMLRPALEGTVIDCTVGAGGHAEALLEASQKMTMLGIDRDPEAVELARQRLFRFGGRVRVRQGNFRDLGTILAEEGVKEVAAAMFDLGVSGIQIRNPARGFSFMREGPLDMRMGPDSRDTAASLLARMDERELGRMIREYGEDPRARKIARRIVTDRERNLINTTSDLARAVAACVPGRRGRRTHPATRTFQAVRIGVNDELGALKLAMPQVLESLRPGGRMAFISFHSLEDRLVKRFLAGEARGCVCPPEIPVCRCDHRPRVAVLTRKPVTAGPRELEENPEARSAKLRAAEKL